MKKTVVSILALYSLSTLACEGPNVSREIEASATFKNAIQRLESVASTREQYKCEVLRDIYSSYTKISYTDFDYNERKSGIVDRQFASQILCKNPIGNDYFHASLNGSATIEFQQVLDPEAPCYGEVFRLLKNVSINN